jgi:hypothetical protein
MLYLLMSEFQSKGDNKLKATRVVASALGIAAGLLGMEHGIFEFLQGNIKADNVIINAFGPTCQVEKVWHGCEPALTLIPNYLLTGICAIIAGCLVAYWAGFQVTRNYGGEVLISLCIILLLVGGGIAPIIVGVIAGILGTRINKAHMWWRKHINNEIIHFLANAWLWFLVPLLLWIPGEWILGLFINDILIKLGLYPSLMVLLFMLLSSISGISYDVKNNLDISTTNI